MRQFTVLLLAAAMLFGLAPGAGGVEPAMPLVLQAPAGSTGLSYEDDLLKITFKPWTDGLDFALENRGTDSFRVVWGFCYFKGPTGKPRRLGHGSAPGRQEKASKVLPGEVYRELVYPADRVKGTGVEEFLRDEVIEGGGFDLILALELTGQVKRYAFHFGVKHVIFKPKSPGLAAGLSLLLPSLGHGYVGEWGRGLIFAVPRTVMGIGGALRQEPGVSSARKAYIFFGIAEALDVYQRASEANKYLLQRRPKESPTP